MKSIEHTNAATQLIYGQSLYAANKTTSKSCMVIPLYVASPTPKISQSNVHHMQTINAQGTKTSETPNVVTCQF